jgi:hypothetical protein
MMPNSFRIGIGAIITAVGLARLFYTMPITSNAAASKGPVFSEEEVPKYPDAMKAFIPIEMGAAVALIAGISVMSVGLADAHHRPQKRA